MQTTRKNKKLKPSSIPGNRRTTSSVMYVAGHDAENTLGVLKMQVCMDACRDEMLWRWQFVLQRLTITEVRRV